VTKKMTEGAAAYRHHLERMVRSFCLERTEEAVREPKPTIRSSRALGSTEEAKEARSPGGGTVFRSSTRRSLAATVRSSSCARAARSLSARMDPTTG
jgi:hypothetical protein